LPKSTKVRSHGNNVRDVIIVHMISADAHIYRRGNRKVILGPAGRLVKIIVLLVVQLNPLEISYFNLYLSDFTGATHRIIMCSYILEQI